MCSFIWSKSRYLGRKRMSKEHRKMNKTHRIYSVKTLFLIKYMSDSHNS